MGLIARGQAMINRLHKETEAVTISYVRGTTTEQLPARVGRTLFSGIVQGPSAVQWGDRDYLIEVADLVDAGLGPVPQKGDRIIETIDGTPTTFELLSPPDGGPVWRYSDQYRTLFRLHAKRVG